MSDKTENRIYWILGTIAVVGLIVMFYHNAKVNLQEEKNI